MGVDEPRHENRVRALLTAVLHLIFIDFIPSSCGTDYALDEWEYHQYNINVLQGEF